MILDEETSDLLGYFSITFKEITYPADGISNTANRRAGAVPDSTEGLLRVRAYLIGQLGKNKSIENNPISLPFILDEIYGIIHAARELVGGRAVILECAEDNKLISLYEKCGFQRIQMEPNHNGDVTMYIIVKN